MTKLNGQFEQLIFSPKGMIEGVLLTVDGSPIQVAFDKHDEALPAPFMSLHQGQAVAVAASLAGPSAKGAGEHAVYRFERLMTVDGEKPASQKAKRAAGYGGIVTRLNYARHGEANGVVLDSGDFIHMKPEGMAKLKLKVGDSVTADGDAHLLATGKGWAVEAYRVNGKAVSSD